MIHPHIPHYFSHHVNREVKEVYWSAAFFNLALTLTFIFEPIFLYKLGYGLGQILIFYAFVYFWYSVLIFGGARVTSLIGYKHAMFLGSVFYVLYWLTLYQIGSYASLFYFAPVLLAIQKSLFWPAYDAEVAISSQKSQRGREVAVLFSTIELVTIVGPLLGGAISYFYGFQALFLVGSILMLFSVYPLFRSKEVYTRHKFHFRNFIKVFRRYPLNFLGYWGYAEDLMIMTLWPVFMFLTVSSVFHVGTIATFASIIATVIMLYLGKLTDRLSKVELVQVGALVYGLTWVFRFLAKGFWPVLTFDALTRTGKGFLNVPMISLTYDLAGSEGSEHAIAYSVFYEFSLAIGKVLTALSGIVILALTGNVFWVFAFVGILTMFYGLLRK
ncbi:MAG: MFS transporter [Candidatus Doudnabacteria bacterium]|nr:MFS transporter [Candidatus Doudnabacteria bacterium]